MNLARIALLVSICLADGILLLFKIGPCRCRRNHQRRRAAAAARGKRRASAGWLCLGAGALGVERPILSLGVG